MTSLATGFTINPPDLWGRELIIRDEVMDMRRAVLSFLVASGLAGCGGGGGGGGNTPSAAMDLVINGTVATGLAVANASVSAKCQAGTGKAVSAADGSFQMSIAGGQLPCALEALDPIANRKMHTLAVGSGLLATANITPLTDLVAARMASGDPNAFFTSFGASIAKTITPAMVQTAMSDVTIALGCTIDTTKLGDFMSTAMKAATAANPNGGDAMDKMLDSLAAKVSPAQLARIMDAIGKPGALNDMRQMVNSVMSTLNVPGLPTLVPPSCKA